MFPAAHTDGHLQQSKQEQPPGHGPTPIQDIQKIVREETQGGRLIVRFFVSAMEGRLEGSKPCHRLDAARQLVNLGFSEAQAFVDHNAQPPNRRRTSPSPPPKHNLRSVLFKIVREETDDGRLAVRFLVDVMQGALPGFKPHHRLSAAKELLRRGFDDTLDDDRRRPPAGRQAIGCRPQPIDHNSYAPMPDHDEEPDHEVGDDPYDRPPDSSDYRQTNGGPGADQPDRSPGSPDFPDYDEAPWDRANRPRERFAHKEPRTSELGEPPPNSPKSDSKNPLRIFF